MKHFEPFQKVLYRIHSYSQWFPGLYGFYDKDFEDEGLDEHFLVGAGRYKIVIPYEGNEHLLGKKDEPQSLLGDMQCTSE